MKNFLLFLAIAFCQTLAAPLLMLPMESDIDNNITDLWKNSLKQILKESNLDPIEVDREYFSECENVECAISKARAAGAQGLFRGRLKKSGKDSISIRFHIDWLAGNTTPQTSVQGTVPLAWAQTLGSGILLKMFSGIIGKNFETEHEKKDAYAVIKVETNPEDVVVMLNGESICLSPCAFSATSNSYAQIAAYWDSGENLWAAKRTVKLGTDTTKVFLELKRSLAETEIRSLPEKALIFPEGALDVKTKPIGKTPYKMRGLPGDVPVRIFREGYNDTLVNINIDAVERQIHVVHLTALNSEQPTELSLLVKKQNRRNVGIGLMGGSIGPLVSGIFLCKLGMDNYDNARSLKNDLERMPFFGGQNFQAKVDENRKAVKDGDFKTGVGAGLIGLSVLLAGIGFSLTW